jgi:hypothetical protein
MDEYFTGQHEKIVLKAFEDASRLRHFTELDRLSLLVFVVSQECQVVPVGAYKMIPTHELVPNPNFKGLKIEQSKSLENYVHLRRPTLPEKQLLIGILSPIQRAARPSSATTSSTPSARTQSGMAGHCSRTSRGPRSLCAVWYGRATWVTTAQTPTSSAGSTSVTVSAARTSPSSSDPSLPLIPLSSYYNRE